MKNIRFDNRVLRYLPIDSEKQNFTREVRNACFSYVNPAPIFNPSIVALSPSALGLIGINPAVSVQLAETGMNNASKHTTSITKNTETAQNEKNDEVERLKEDILKYLSGNEVMVGSTPASHCYCGHQFGSFAGQLGDGAAIYLGEVQRSVTFAPPPLQPFVERESTVDSGNTKDSFSILAEMIQRAAEATAMSSDDGADARSALYSPLRHLAPRYKAPPYRHAYPFTVTSTGGWELQLKGAGVTPYSRNADGRKVLRSSLREFIASEFMAAVGVPTTRAGSLITSDTKVVRDPIYSGDNVMERCTVVSRIAETFIRFGSFEVCKPAEGTGAREGPSAGNTDILLQLFSFVAENYFADLADEAKKIVAEVKATETRQKRAAAINNAVAKANSDSSAASAGSTDSTYTATAATSWQELASTRIFAEICRRTAFLVARWQSLGWVHGVLNTDNMSIVGLTIDYGPFAFLTNFDNQHVSNLSDHGGRYAYGQQPAICQWNLEKLAEAWSLLFPAQKLNFGNIITEHYGISFNEAYKREMAKKLGIDYDAVVKEIRRESESGDFSKKISPPGSENCAANHVDQEAREESFDACVMDLIGELMVTLQTTGAEFTNTFTLLRKALTVTSQQMYTADTETETANLNVARQIAALCISPSAKQTILRRRISQLRPSMHPRQVEQLLQMATDNPERLREVFKGDVRAEELISYLEEERRKIQSAFQLRSELEELTSIAEDAKREADTLKWSAFIRYYRKAVESINEILSAKVPAPNGSVLKLTDELRKNVMSEVNPVFVPFPWVLQEAISQAEAGQYSLVRNLLDRCMKPFEEDKRDGVLWNVIPPPDAEEICVSCSS